MNQPALDGRSRWFGKLQAVLVALMALLMGPRASADYAVSFVPGPSSPVYEINGSGNPVNSGWFPDAHFPLTWGGANEPSVNLSWWSNRRQGSSLDDTLASPGGTWIPGGAYGSGDYRGYWITSIFRPSDYQPSLLGTSASLTIYSTDNSSNSIVSHTIDHNYLVGFAHTEDYNSTGGVTNNSRTIYSFDNGLTWNKGPWGTGVLVAIDNRTTPGTPRYVTLNPTSLKTTTNLATGDGWTSTSAPSYNPSNFAFNNALFYNRYLGMWMVWYGKWGSTNTTAWTAVSSDLVNWQWGTGNIGMNNAVPGGATAAAGNYPTMIGSLPTGTATTMTNYDTECGQMAWLYNNIGGLGGRALHFIKGTRQDIAWMGGSGSLSTVGNWSVTGGGTFSGFTDESQTLAFNTGSGSLNNDLAAASMRVRGIVYGSGAGSYDITGNTLELEAYYYGSNYALTSIGNLSANTQTIDANIDARSAALYVRAANAPIVINGNIDMWGNGGIVVYGTSPTTLNGVISNSGYHDFTSGQAEAIADANEARLVKQDSATLTLGGTNTFAGRTDIYGGVIQLTNGNALQNSVVTFNVDNALLLSSSTKLGGLNGSGNLALGSANLTLGNNNAYDGYVARYSGSLSGAGSLTKTGANTQRISSSNSYTGGTNLNGGVLEVPGNVNTALGTGSVTFGGGSIKALGAITLGNPVVVNSGGGGVLCNGNAVTFSGTLSGTGGLTTDGTGSLILTGANTYSGGTVIQNTVQVASSGGLGTGPFSLNGGTLQITNNINLGSQGISITANGSAIDTGTYTLTSSGSITVASGQTFVKLGTGTFNWSGSGSSFNGDLAIDAGSINYTGTGTLTLTNGNITLNGSQLALQPAGSGGSVVVNLAQGSGKILMVNGAGNLWLNQGSNTNLTVNIGGSSNANALHLDGTSTFLITVGGGTAQLGSSSGVSVFAYGTADTSSGAIFPPNMLASSGIDGQGDYVTYASATGFSAFTGYTARTGTFSQTSSSTTEIANVTATATLSASSYAESLRISGTNTLNLNGKTYTMTGLGGAAGIVINSGTISGGTLAFGTNRGYLYTSSTTGATLGSVVSGSGGLSVFGAPGTVLNLSGSNTYTGGFVVNGATAVISGGGLGNASGSATVDGQGTLSITYTTTSARSYIIGSGGGTLNMPGTAYLTMSTPLSGSGDWHKTGTGTLQLNGNNTFTGDLYVDAGNVAFNGRTTFFPTSGTFHVASGATITGWGWGTSTSSIGNDFVVSGTGISNSGAVQFSGNATWSGNIMLSGDALLTAGPTTSATFTGQFYGPNCNLTMSSPGSGAPLVVNGSMSLGTGSLTVTGAGGVTFGSTADASFTGTTAVSSGSHLTVNGTLEGNSGVSVSGTLAGTGNIFTTGSVAIASGGFLMAGSGTTPGMLTISGDLSLDALAEYQSYVNGSGISIGGNAGYGQMVILGSGTLNGTLRLFRSSGYTPHAGDQLFVALRNGGSGSFSQVIVVDGGVPTTYSGAPGTSITIGGVTGTIAYNAQSSQALTSGSHDVVIQF